MQLVLGLVTLPFSFAHTDGAVMLQLSHWAQGIVTVQPVDAKTLQGLDWPYLVHLVLGMTIFLLFPFSRLVHIWSAPVWYLGRRGLSGRAHAPAARRGGAARQLHASGGVSAMTTIIDTTRQLHSRRNRPPGQSADLPRPQAGHRQRRRHPARGDRARNAEPPGGKADRGLAAAAARALVVRELLLQEARRLAIAPEPAR